MGQRAVVFIYLAVYWFVSGYSAEWKNLHLKFPSYFNIPLGKSELLGGAGNYSLMAQDKQRNLEFYGYNNDPRVSVGYDWAGNIAAVRLALVKDEIGKVGEKKGLSFPLEFYKKPLFSNGNFFKNDVWYTDVLFEDPLFLKQRKRSSKSGTVGNNVYLKLNGQWTIVPKNMDVSLQGEYVLGKCYKGMGFHTFYRYTATLSCTDMQGVFAIYDHDRTLSGLGLFMFGSQGSSDGQRTWYEVVTSNAQLRLTAPEVPPSCMLDWIDKFSISCFHIFFGSNPRSFTC